MKKINIGRGIAVLLTATTILSGCNKTEEEKNRNKNSRSNNRRM